MIHLIADRYFHFNIAKVLIALFGKRFFIAFREYTVQKRIRADCGRKPERL